MGTYGNVLVIANYSDSNTLTLADLNGNPTGTLTLSTTFSAVKNVKFDGSNNIYLLAAINQIYILDSNGNLQKTLGLGTAQYEHPTGKYFARNTLI